jgi:hypothetical protein
VLLLGPLSELPSALLLELPSALPWGLELAKA